MTDTRTADQVRRDADGVDYGDLATACPNGHLHFCPECGKQHMHDGEHHPDCELRGLEHAWNRWEPHAVEDLVEVRFCDRCGSMERQELRV